LTSSGFSNTPAVNDTMSDPTYFVLNKQGETNKALCQSRSEWRKGEYMMNIG